MGLRRRRSRPGSALLLLLLHAPEEVLHMALSIYDLLLKELHSRAVEREWTVSETSMRAVTQ